MRHPDDNADDDKHVADQPDQAEHASADDADDRVNLPLGARVPRRKFESLDLPGDR